MTTQTLSPSIPAVELSRDLRQMFIGGIVLAALLVWLFWDFVERQFLFAITYQADWGHTLIIPFIAGYIVWLQRDKIRRVGFRTTWIGLLPIMLGIGWYMLCVFGPAVLWHHNLRGAGVAATLFGVVLLFGGWRAMRYLFFPLAYLVIFGQTISDQLITIVTFWMQGVTARGAELFMMLIGLEVQRQGNTIYLFEAGSSKGFPLNIAEACSGMRMLMAFLALGVAMAFTGLKHFWQQALLVLCAFPTAIAVNVIRVVTLGLLTRIDPEFAAGDFHTFIGLVWLVPAFLIFLGLLWLIKNLIVETPQPRMQEAKAAQRIMLDRTSRIAFIIVCLALIACGVGFRAAVGVLNIALKKEPVELREHFANIPKSLEDWKAPGKDAVLSAEIIESLGTEQYLSRMYVREMNGQLQAIELHVAYYTGMIDAIPHIPDRCFEAAGLKRVRPQPENLPLDIDQSGWLASGHVNRATGEEFRRRPYYHPVTNEARQVHFPMGDYRLRTMQFSALSNPENKVFGGYLFIANGRIDPSPQEVKRIAFDPQEQYAYYCKVQFTAHGGREFTEAVYLEQVSDLFEEVLPHLMWSLPDWPEIKARQQAANP